MSILNTISRILVGSLFIVSGLIKANDTLGFSYKLVEYFEPGVLNLEFLIPFALPLAIIICIVEVVLGILTLCGVWMKLNAWLLLGMILFFTWLTFYSAYFNKVTDCGCFGDAIKLTPWESFSKDVALLFFVLIIFINKGKTVLNTVVQDKVILPISLVIITLFSMGMLSWVFPWVFALLIFVKVLALKRFYSNPDKLKLAICAAAVLFSSVFTYYTYAHLPLRDFRPYAVGKSIPEGMKSAEDLGLEPPAYAVDYLLKNKTTGEEQVYNSVAYTNDKLYETWDFVESVSEPYKIKDGYESPIHDFNILNANSDITYEILESNKPILLVISYDIAHAREDVQADVNTLIDASAQVGMDVLGLSASNEVELAAFIKKTNSKLDYATADGIVLKTIVRSNPGLVLLKKGVVIAKWHANDIPTVEDIQNTLSK